MSPRVLVLFATTDGHTEKIARALADVLAGSGAPVDVVEAADGAPSPEAYAGVIVAASVHAGGYQRSVRRWVRTHAEALQRMPAAFVSVCLGVLQHDATTRADLDAILERFVTTTGWRPAIVKPVAGALLYTRYGWVRRFVMRRIVAKAGGDTDTSRDYEYTDWADLRQFARDFRTAIDAAHAAKDPSVAAHPATVMAGS